MTRTQEREQAFIMIFESEFNTEVGVDELFSYAYETESFEKSVYTENVTRLALEKLSDIDSVIEKYSVGWKKARLPKVTLAVLRLALCEIMFVDTVPVSVSANEAVELAKKYATESDASFINGILGTYIRDTQGNA